MGSKAAAWPLGSFVSRTGNLLQGGGAWEVVLHTSLVKLCAESSEKANLQHPLCLAGCPQAKVNGPHSLGF